MSELQLGNPETLEQQTVPVNDESARPKNTTEAEALLQILREERRRGCSVYPLQIREVVGVDKRNQAFRELKGLGFKIRCRLELLDDEAKVSYDLVFDPEFDVAC